MISLDFNYANWALDVNGAFFTTLELVAADNMSPYIKPMFDTLR